MMLDDFKGLLIGEKLSNINRVCNLICVHFASENGIDEGKGFHIACWLRIIVNQVIFVASDDMYLAADYENYDFKYDADESLFDLKINQLMSDFPNTYLILK